MIPMLSLKKLDCDFTICKVDDLSGIDLEKEYFFLSKTDEEISLVCPTMETPLFTVAREDGWRGFRVEGILEFSLIGILAKISSLLAEHGIGIFVVSTYNTDYVFTKENDFDLTLRVLSQAGYEIL